VHPYTWIYSANKRASRLISVSSLSIYQNHKCWILVCVGSLQVLRFLPLFKNMHVRLDGDSELSLEVRLSVHGCLSLSGPVMWPRQGCTLA